MNPSYSQLEDDSTQRPPWLGLIAGTAIAIALALHLGDWQGETTPSQVFRAPSASSRASVTWNPSTPQLHTVYITDSFEEAESLGLKLGIPGWLPAVTADAAASSQYAVFVVRSPDDELRVEQLIAVKVSEMIAMDVPVQVIDLRSTP
jgi:hypothetical protein